MHFTARGLVLAGTDDPCDPEFGVTGASLVHLPDGRWRMYYQARQSGPPSPPNCRPIPFQIYSAISRDGITFTREGVRIAAHSEDHSSALGGAAHGRVLLLDDGTFAAIISGVATPGTPTGGIYLLTSSDGLNFGPSRQLPAPSNAHDPYVVKVGGRYVLYADASPPDATSAFMLTSPDGLNWSVGSSASFVDASGAAFVFHTDLFAPPPDPRHNIGDIGGVVLGDGTLRLYSNYYAGFASYRRIDSQPPQPPSASTNYEGLWWNAPAASESGWGINFAHQGNVIFATWFTYNFVGNYWWLTMTANEVADNFYSGTLYQTNGPPFSAVPFDPAQVSTMAIGSGAVYFSDADNGIFTYQIGGMTQAKQITREAFGPLPVCVWGEQSDLTLATNYQDLWWAAPAGVESGWGVNLTQQGTTIFATWFTYDANRMPLWYSLTAIPIALNAFSGTLYRTIGPAFDAVPFDPTLVQRMPVGTATFTFSDGNNGTFAYQVNDPAGPVIASQTKAITRQVFRSPGTMCQ